MERYYSDYLRDVVDAINDIENFIKGMDFDAFEKDRKTINAVVRSLEVIGEAVKKLPENITNEYLEIPWKNIAGMRDKLIHEYFGVDEKIVWKAALEELPPLKGLFQKILEKEQSI